MSVQETIQDPLSVIQQLFDEQVENTNAIPTNFDPSPHFNDLFKHQQDLLQIPSLNQVPASLLQKNSLVRFRCMLQDSGLGQEMFVSASKKKQENGIEKLVCNWYTDDLMDVETDLETAIPNEQFSERSITYCISPPGETAWVKNASYSSSDATENLSGANIYGSTSATTAAATATTTLKQKFPLVDEDHISAIVKFYGDCGSLRVGQLVDIIGVMGAASRNLDATMDEHEIFDSHLAEFKNTPALHAITCTNVQGTMGSPFFTNTQLDDAFCQARDIQGPLIDYIATYLGGDKLVSEFVLLQLLSKVSSERHGLKIGQFCLNISNFTPGSKSSSTQSIINMISSLVLHHVSIPLTIQNLNTSRFSPQSVNENLLSGVLQLVPGTHVLIDELELSEGQLGDTGVRNMQALVNVIQNQKVTYAFPYSQFDFDVDLGFITLSTGKSLLPNHCTITIKPVYPLDQSQEDNRSLPTRQQLDIFRMYIQAARHASYEIPESLSQYIQDNFVKERKQAAEQHLPLPSQDDLMLRMNLCRLVALSFGEHILTKETYDYAVQLDQHRKSRNLEMAGSTSLV